MIERVVARTLILLAALLPVKAMAQTMPPTAPTVVTRVSEKPVRLADLPPPRRFVTTHRTSIGGKGIEYQAIAGETYIANLAGEPIASIFSFSYIAGGSDPARPVMFVFNGGPGSSSVWLHMGAVGPRRLVLDAEVNPTSVPPFGVRDNPFSVLDVADLVFIDPVGTGYSHALGNARDSDFYGVDADADAVARFIEAWLSEHGRWNSPKYLMGESYGSVRAAVLPRALLGGPFYGGTMRGITIDGVIMLGLALDTGRSGKTGLTAEQRLLPAMAATAWYHRKIDRAGRTAQQVHDDAARFAVEEYGPALAALDAGTLGAADKARIAARLAAFTGLDAKGWSDAGLRIAALPFLKGVIADKGLEAGAYDSRYTLPLAGGLGDPVADDPAMGRYVPGFIGAFHDMLHRDLKVKMPVPYRSITWVTLNQQWNWERVGIPPAPGFGAELAAAMRRNPRLRVMAASGLYDMVTTAAAGEDQIRQAKLPADRVTLRTYESGHMLYLGETAPQFAGDVRDFIRAGAAGR